MASWRARALALAVRIRMRREDWGDERALARRARRIFGAAWWMRWLAARGVRVETTARGEWVVPDGADERVILYFHGGGYVGGSAARDRPITAGLARRTGRRVFSLEYRLAPEHRFPAAVDDAVAAYAWLLETGVSPRAISLAGTSAGGNLVLATLLRLRDARVPLPDRAICFSPWTDLAGTGDSLRMNDGRCAVLRRANIPAFARAYLGDASPRDPYASPLYGDLAGLPPLLIQVDGDEVLLDDARRLHASVQRAGGTSRLDVFDGLFHAWQLLDPFIPEARVALDRAAAFLATDAARGSAPAGASGRDASG